MKGFHESPLLHAGPGLPAALFRNEAEPGRHRPLQFSAAWLLSWLVRLESGAPDPSPQEQAWLSRLQPVLDHVRRNPGDPLPAQKAASLCHMSLHHFCRVFRQAGRGSGAILNRKGRIRPCGNRILRISWPSWPGRNRNAPPCSSSS